MANTSNTNSTSNKPRRILNIIIAVCVFGAWLLMFIRGGQGLSAAGFTNLKFFTVLSNLFEGIATIYWLVKPGEKAERIKYIATAAVSVTFITVMAFLGPLYGYPMMFTGANLFFHLLIPLAAIAECIWLAHVKFTRRDNLLTTIPALVYGTVYLFNNIINGIGEWPNTNDWYGFLNWGYPIGIAIFGVVVLISWLSGFIIRKVAR